MVGDNTTAGGSSSPSRLSDTPLELPREDPVFNKEQCLFCNKLNGSLEANVAHMQAAHSFFIADRERLAIDLETLLAYLHLVIVGYNECICCGTQRSTTQAVQQHMLGKGHCRFDIESSDSEYADFYDLSGSEAESEEEDDKDNIAAFTKCKGQSPPVQDDEGSLRLPSGRIISNRSQPQRNWRRRPLSSSSPGGIQRLDGVESTSSNRDHQAAPSASSQPTAASQPGTSGLALTRAERREDKFSKQLATLRASDAGALVHLSSSEQRAVLARQQKQVEKAARVEQRYRTRLEGLGNQFLMGHFVKDAADKRTLWK